LTTLPRFTEIKRRLDGRLARFDCELVERRPDVIRLRYRLPQPWRVHGVELPSGTVTLAHYWIGRPFNLYQWVDGHGRSVGYYFNIGSPPAVEDDRLEWMDWFLDVLVLPGSAPEVLDRDDLPAGLAPSVAKRIEAALVALLVEIDNRVSEAEDARARLLPMLLASPAEERSP